MRAQAVISSLRRGAHTVGSDSRQDPYTSERSLSIRTAKGVPWLTMTLRSRATSAKYLPLYCDRDVIRGDVTLDLQEDMRVKDIVLKVRIHLNHTKQLLNTYVGSTAAKCQTRFPVPTSLSSTMSIIFGSQRTARPPVYFPKGDTSYRSMCQSLMRYPIPRSRIR